jgi:hypothetical protein
MYVCHALIVVWVMYVLGDAVVVSILHCTCFPSHHVVFRGAASIGISQPRAQALGRMGLIHRFSCSLSLSLCCGSCTCPISQTLPPWYPCYSVHQICSHYLHVYVHSKTAMHSTAHSVYSYKYCEPAFSGKLPP